MLPGPDRPGLIRSQQCAFVARTDLKSREATLLRVDPGAFAGGCLFWQSDGDAYELDDVVTSLEAGPTNPRENVKQRWSRFWGSNYAGPTVIGPREAGLRFRDWPRPGRVEPADLILERVAPAQPARPQVGADLPSLGILPRPVRPGPRRN